MARPVKRRRICCLPEVTEFIPGDGKAEGTVTMTMDEFEAVRLIDRGRRAGRGASGAVPGGLCGSDERRQDHGPEYL